MNNKNSLPLWCQSKKNAVFFIAEVGGNHEGDYNYARLLTKQAIESGADAVKFQFYTGDSLVSPIESPSRNQHFKKFELTNEQNLELVKYVTDNSVLPMASVWNYKMLEIVNPHLSIHKVGSGDLTCYPMLKALTKTKKPIILSTGLSSLSEIEQSVKYIESCDCSYITEKKLALLQCTSSYPTPDEDANLEAMLTLQKEFNLPIGYSDHTLGTEAIEVAVALGAQIIEKHFTDTREGKTFRDHLISLTKTEVQSTLRKLDRIKILKGKPDKELTQSEEAANHHISFRRGIYALKDIDKGEILTNENLTVLRPSKGISADNFEKLIGLKVKKKIKKFHAITQDSLL